MYTIESKVGDSMTIKIILGMLFLMTFFPLCKKEIPTEPIQPLLKNIHIEGLVTESGRPIEGITINLVNWNRLRDPPDRIIKSVESRGDGRYTIKYLIDCNTHHFLEARYEWRYWSNIYPGILYTEELQIIDIEF
jgi:hypothetical protein